MRWVLRLYPRGWRDRYEDEMLALLEDHKITPLTVIDLLLGAADANLNYTGLTEGVSCMANRIRSGVVMAFCSFILFGIGWSLLQRLTDPLPDFRAVDQIHPEFGILYHAVFITGCLSFVAFLAGGLPVFFVAVKRAFKTNKRDVLVPFWTALACLLAFIVSTATLVAWHPHTHIYPVLIGYLGLVALLLVAGTVAVSLVVAKTEFQLNELKFIFVPEVTILFCMIVCVVLAIVLIVSLTAYAPQLFQTQDVSSPMFILGLLFMALGTIFAAVGLKRGQLVHV